MAAAAAFAGQVVAAIPSWADGPGVTIPVGASPQGVVTDGGSAYVANDASGTVSVIDEASGSVTHTITVGGLPFGLAADGGKVYVAEDIANSSVSVIDESSASVVATIAVGNFAGAVAADGANLYVANGGDSTVSVVDTATDTVTGTISVGAGPVALVADGGEVYVANTADNSVSVIDEVSGTVTATIAVGGSPDAVAADGGKVYVANSADDTVSVIDEASGSVSATIPVGGYPAGVVAHDGRAYVSDNADNAVSVIDEGSAAVVGSIPVGDGPAGIAIDGATVYVANARAATVSVFSVMNPVQYDGNGAAGGAPPADGSSPYNFASMVAVLGNTGGLTRTGYTFSGWNTAANGTGVSYQPGDSFSMPAQPVTLYAQWRAQQTSPPAPSMSVISSEDPSVSGDSITFTATMSPVPSCGSVSWLIDNAAPPAGVPSGGSGSTFTLGPVSDLSVGVHPVTVVFSGCALAGERSASVNQEVDEPSASPTPAPTGSGPTITAHVSSAHHENDGWYRSPVHVAFTCTPGSAPLAAACPDAVTLSKSRADQTVTRTITDTDGGSDWVTVKVNIDRHPPALRVSRAGHKLSCEASDALSGLKSCTIRRHRHTRRGMRTVHWIATATDRAGNTVNKRGRFRFPVD